PGQPQHRLDGFTDVLPVFAQQPVVIAHAKRREPPRHVVIPGHNDDLADSLGMLDEGSGALELAGSGALRQITGDRDDVVALLLNHRFDRLVLLRHRGMSEVLIRSMKQGDPGHSLAMIVYAI